MLNYWSSLPYKKYNIQLLTKAPSMKLQILLCVLGLCCSIQNTELIAQNVLPSTFPDGEFIVLQDSTLLMLGDFSVKRKFGTFRFFDNDGRRIADTRIKYSYLGEKFKGHYQGSPLSMNSSGFYNVFGGVSYSGSPQNGGLSRNVDYYFAEAEFGELRRVKYPIVEEELLLNRGQITDDELNDVMSLVYKGKKKSNWTIQLIGIGIGTMIVGGIWMDAAEGGSSFSRNASLGTVILGLGTAVVGISRRPSEEYYYDAVLKYNRYYSDQ